MVAGSPVAGDAKLVATVSNGAVHTEKSSHLDGVLLSVPDGTVLVREAVRRVWSRRADPSVRNGYKGCHDLSGVVVGVRDCRGVVLFDSLLCRLLALVSLDDRFERIKHFLTLEMVRTHECTTLNQRLPSDS